MSFGLGGGKNNSSSKKGGSKRRGADNPPEGLIMDGVFDASLNPIKQVFPLFYSMAPTAKITITHGNVYIGSPCLSNILVAAFKRGHVLHSAIPNAGWDSDESTVASKNNTGFVRCSARAHHRFRSKTSRVSKNFADYSYGRNSTNRCPDPYRVHYRLDVKALRVRIVKNIAFRSVIEGTYMMKKREAIQRKRARLKQAKRQHNSKAPFQALRHTPSREKRSSWSSKKPEHKESESNRASTGTIRPGGVGGTRRAISRKDSLFSDDTSGTKGIVELVERALAVMAVSDADDSGSKVTTSNLTQLFPHLVVDASL